MRYTDLTKKAMIIAYRQHHGVKQSRNAVYLPSPNLALKQEVLCLFKSYAMI